MTIQEMREKRAKLVSQAKAIAEGAKAADREMTADETAKVDALLDEGDSIEAQIKQADAAEKRSSRLSESVEALARPNGRKTAPDQPSATRNAGVVKEAWEDDPMKGYKSPKSFLLDVIEAGRNGKMSNQLRFLATAGSDEQSTFSDPYGGFFVPEGMSPNVLQVGFDVDPTAGRTTQVPMTNPVVKFNARVDKNHSSSVSGGLTVSRRGEANAATSSRAQHEQVKLEATGLFGLAYATEEILERSAVSFAAILEAGFRDEFASKIIDEKISGTGVGEMEGILTSPALISVAKESGQSADTINSTNILKMRKRAWQYGNCIWLANHDTYDQLVPLHVAGTNGDVFIFNPARGEDVPDMLLGRPIFFSEHVPGLGDQGDIVLSNWSQYLEGTLNSIRGAESIHVRFVNHERTFRFWLENDGRCWWRSALTPKNGANTLSPFVVLDERA